MRSYFQAGRTGDFSYGIKTEELVRQIADVEFIVTDNEVEAFILEASLVKKHQPYFNYKLKDDKSYPHLKLTVNEPFPRCVITRRIQNDGALYFGPFLPASMARRTIDLINRTFQLRTCDIEIDGKAPRPVSGVSHQTLSRAVRQGTVHAGRISGSSARRAHAARRPQHRTRRQTRSAHAARFGRACVTSWPQSIAICARR